MNSVSQNEWVYYIISWLFNCYDTWTGVDIKGAKKKKVIDFYLYFD